jgi:hypothetical protein
LAVQQFTLQMRNEVGGAVTTNAIRAAGQMEREIRQQAEDGHHYLLLEQLLVNYVGNTAEAIHDYMNPDDRRYRR